MAGMGFTVGLHDFKCTLQKTVWCKRLIGVAQRMVSSAI